MKIFKRKINRLNQRGDTLTSIFVSLVVIAAVIMTASYLLIRSSNLAQATRETTQINQLLASQVEALKNKVYTDPDAVFEKNGATRGKNDDDRFCFGDAGQVIELAGINIPTSYVFPLSWRNIYYTPAHSSQDDGHGNWASGPFVGQPIQLYENTYADVNGVRISFNFDHDNNGVTMDTPDDLDDLKKYYYAREVLSRNPVSGQNSCDKLGFLEEVANLKLFILYKEGGTDDDTDTKADNNLFEIKATWTPAGGGANTDMTYYYRIHPVETTTSP